MRQRDQLGGALGGLDAGEAGDGEGVPLGQVGQADQGLGGEQHAARGLGHAAGDGFLRDVHHVGAALGVEMAEGTLRAHGAVRLRTLRSAESGARHASIRHPAMRLAIVVPALERGGHPAPVSARGLVAAADEVIVSDGGSADGTVAVARRSAPASSPGRRGAAASSAAAPRRRWRRGRRPALPPRRHEAAARGAAALRAAVARGAPGGAFFLRFDVDRPMQRLGSRLDQLAHAPAARAAGRPGASSRRARPSKGWAASATGRCWKTWTSSGGCAASPASR